MPELLSEGLFTLAGPGPPDMVQAPIFSLKLAVAALSYPGRVLLLTHSLSVAQGPSGDPDRDFWLPDVKQSALKTWRGSGW